MIYGLPESTSTSTAERQQNDTNIFCELAKSEFKIESLDISKSVRLGKQTEGKNRPLLITLTDNYARSHLLMRNAKTLRSSNTYRNVYISPDLTLKEREANKLLRQELFTRKQAGETNLIIRHGKIVSKHIKHNTTPVVMDSTNNQQ